MLTIVYVSAATSACRDAEIERILARSRKNNQRDDISGLLLYVGGNFIQALEGPGEPVRAAFTRIGRDPRHSGIITLLEDETTVDRSFPGWSMDFKGMAELDPDQASATRSFIAETLDERTARTQPHTRALRLLATFRRTMR